jgi:hypothetical protein
MEGSAMSDFRRRLRNAEELAESKVDTLTLDDGRKVSLSPLSWLDLAGAAIDQQADLYEGLKPRPLTERQQRTRELYAKARTDTLPYGERVVSEWSRSQVEGCEHET